MNVDEIISICLDQRDLKTLENIFDNFKINKIELNFDTFNILLNNEKITEICHNLVKSNNYRLDKFLYNTNIYQLLSLYCDLNDIEVSFEETPFDDDIFSSYIKYLNSKNLNVLSKEEEKELLIRYRNGDMNARKIFLEHNLRLVIKNVRKYYRKDFGIDIMDLVEEGNEGLIRAFSTFDETLGYKFSTYATWWISQRIERFIKNNSRSLRLPEYYVDKITDLKKGINELTIMLNHTPTLKEIASFTNFSIDEVKDLMKNNENIISLNDTIKDDNTDTTFIEMIPDKTSTSSDKIMENSINKIYLLDKISLLPKRQQDIIKLRYGLYDGDSKKQEEVGKMLHITKQRVSQMEIRALKKLKLLIENDNKKAKRR